MSSKPLQLAEIRRRYRNGENITQLFRERNGSSGNTVEAIEVAYDMQAGSYLRLLSDSDFAAYNENYTSAIASVIDRLGGAASLLEAGVGEATTLANVCSKTEARPAAILGFDISWSRISVAVQHTTTLGMTPQLFVGDLFNIPLADNSVDVVYTSHSIEPNGGREKRALAELFRVAARYLVLLEPSNELGSADTQKHMKKNGYCWDLRRHCDELGYKVIEHRLFEPIANPRNQTGLIIIEKSANSLLQPEVTYSCPHSRTPLEEVRGHLFSREGLRVFPVIDGIPCLRPENGIIASVYGD